MGIKKHGGYRKGAGRPATGQRKSINFRMDKDVEEELLRHENKSEFINDCIRKCMEMQL